MEKQLIMNNNIYQNITNIAFKGAIKAVPCISGPFYRYSFRYSFH